MSTFRQELEAAINRNNKENGSDTPDWILAHYLDDCLRAFDSAMIQREIWYRRKPGDVPVVEKTEDA